MQVKIKRLNEKAQLPKKGSEGAIAYDVVASEIEHVTPYYVKVKTGLSIEPPQGYGVKLYARSSLTKTAWVLANSVGLGDNDYRGEYELRFRALAFESNEALFEWEDSEILFEAFPYKVGDRVGQIEIVPILEVEWVEDDLSETDRGEGGFGSTGV